MSDSPKKIEYNGVEYPSVNAMIRALGLSRDRVRRRLSLGWTIERAVGEPILRSTVVCDGVSYPSVVDLARAFDVSSMTVRARLKRGCTPEEAIRKSPHPHVRSGWEVEYDGKRYASLSALARAFDVPCARLYSRVKLGWPMDRALADARKHPQPLPQSVVVDGRTFKTITEASQHFGLRRGTFNQRRKRGMTDEEICKLPKRPTIVNDGLPRICARCGVTKERDQFERGRAVCMACWPSIRKLRKYGDGAEKYLDPAITTCNICGSTFSSPRDRHIDHDHASGRVRGLLCSHCNIAIGMLKDDPEVVDRAAAYLRR